MRTLVSGPVSAKTQCYLKQKTAALPAPAYFGASEALANTCIFIPSNSWRRSGNGLGKSRTPARNPTVKFLIRCADVDLHVLVADAASDVTAKLVAAEFTAGVPVIETDLAPGPNQRRSFRGQRFRRRIIFPIFRIFHWPRA